MFELISNRMLYERVIQTAIPSARAFVWIATADIKDLHVHRGRRMIPLLGVLAELVDRGVSLRLLHAREPGPAFRKDFDRYPSLLSGLEMILCPRLHFKSVIVDGRFAYTGSANLTGAGLGAKSDDRRNHELGFVTEDPAGVEQIMEPFDRLWMGACCVRCQRKAYCASYLDLLQDRLD